MKIQHAFAVVRIDDFGKEFSENKVHVVKVVWTEERANSEVERLNRLNAEKGCHYFSQIVRIEQKNAK